MRQKLTNSVIASLSCPENKSDIKCSDTEVTGLKVRVTAKGAKSFIFEKRPKGTGKLRLETLGRVGDLTIEQARSLARKKVLDYEDPNYLFRIADEKARQTFADAYNLYEKIKMSQLADTTRQKQVGLFKREILPVLKDFPLEVVDRKHISAITTGIQASGREGTGQDVWKSVSAFLTWCVQHGYIPLNPILGATPTFVIKSRDRVLSLEEVAKIWNTASSFSPSRMSAVRLLLLLPFRKSEFTACHWAEFDGDLINIPASRAKNGRNISLPLSDFAKQQLPVRRNDTDLMFSTDGRTSTRLDDKLLKRLIALSEVPKFSWHDFRRTFSTHLQEQHNADFEAVEACLNHVTEAKKGVAGVYNRANYQTRMRSAVFQWSEIIEGAVDG